MPPPDDSSLVLDRRQEVPGPGLHAILIGVSEYAYLPGIEDPGEEGLKALKKLASPALSAFRFEQKLAALSQANELPRPLKTVRLLIAPSAYEQASEAGVSSRGALPTKANIKIALRAWRHDMAESADAVGLFYFGGHGIRRALEESILLAADFLDPEEVQLENCFRLSNVRAGMVPSMAFPDIGRTQFYFVDACRDKPDALDTMDDTQTPKIFDAALNTLDDRKAPIYFATYAGGLAAGNPGQETYFYKAIDWALDHASGEPASDNQVETWPVTAFSLKKGIERQNSLFEGRVELTGLIGDPVICAKQNPPVFDARISINPDIIRPSVKIARLYEINRSEEVVLPGPDDPRVVHIKPGLYRLEIEPANGEFPVVKTNAVRLGFDYKMPWLIRVGGSV